MAKLWQFSQGHPKATFSEKVQRGDQGKFFKNRAKSSPRLKGPKPLWRKWHYPVNSKPAFSQKVQRGTKGTFRKNRPKGSLPLKGP